MGGLQYIRGTIFVFVIAGAIGSISISCAQAGWGCGANNASRIQSRSWGEPSESSARKSAMERCVEVAAKNHDSPSCRIASCSSSVDTPDEARALWPIDRKR